MTHIYDILFLPNKKNLQLTFNEKTNMKIFAVISIARQVEGEMCVVKIDKAYTSASKADAFAKALSKKYAEEIQTPHGPISFVCERGVFEIEVEEP